MRYATEIEALRIAADVIHPLDLAEGEGTRYDDLDDVRDFAARQCHLVYRGERTDGEPVYVPPIPAAVRMRGRGYIAPDTPCLLNGFQRAQKPPKKKRRNSRKKPAN